MLLEAQKIFKILRYAERMVKFEQSIAVAETDFAAYLRPEILGSVVKLVNPKAETVGFQKNISIGDLPERK